MRRLDDITPDMAGAKYFTVADTKNGRKHCYKRLAFGLTCAGDEFQQRIDQVLSGIKRVTGVADDILVWGNTIAEHNARMLASDSTVTNSSTNRTR